MRKTEDVNRVSPISITIALIFTYMVTGETTCSYDTVAEYTWELRKKLKNHLDNRIDCSEDTGSIYIHTEHYYTLSQNVYKYSSAPSLVKLRIEEPIGLKDIEAIWSNYIAIQPEELIAAALTKEALEILFGNLTKYRLQIERLKSFCKENTPHLNPIPTMLALIFEKIAYGNNECPSDMINQYADELVKKFKQNTIESRGIPFEQSCKLPEIPYDIISGSVYQWGHNNLYRKLSYEYAQGNFTMERLWARYIKFLPLDLINAAISTEALCALFGSKITSDAILKIIEFVTNNTPQEGRNLRMQPR